MSCPERRPCRCRSGYAGSPASPEELLVSHRRPCTPAVPVKVVETSKANPLELVRLIVAPLLGPLGMAALVLLLVILHALPARRSAQPAHPAHRPGAHQRDHARDGRRRPPRLALPAHAAPGECDLRHRDRDRPLLYRRAECDRSGARLAPCCASFRTSGRGSPRPSHASRAGCLAAAGRCRSSPSRFLSCWSCC